MAFNGVQTAPSSHEDADSQNTPNPNDNSTAHDMVSLEELQSQRQRFAAEIFKNWHLLRNVVSRHEALIRKRWTKKSHKKRVELLLTAWPNMSPEHRPDFLALRREATEQLEYGGDSREAYLWPCINLEDLAIPSSLPLFLNARAYNAPSVFSTVDENAARLGTVVYRAHSHTGYAMRFHDRDSVDSYGEITAFETKEAAQDIYKKSSAMRPHRIAFQVMEIQEPLLEFLVDCCRIMLHDLPSHTRLGNEYPMHPPMSPLRESMETCGSLYVLTIETQYCPPLVVLEYGRLESLLAARLLAAEDHLWALREDPGYFTDTMNQYRNHRSRAAPDVNSGADIDSRTSTGSAPRHWSLTNMMVDAFILQTLWSAINKRVSHLARLCENLCIVSLPQDRIPADYLDAFTGLREDLQQATTGLLSRFMFLAPRSPISRVFSVDAKSNGEVEFSYVPGSRFSKAHSHLRGYLNILLGGKDVLSALGTSHFILAFAEFVQAEDEARDLMGPLLVALLNDLAILSMVAEQIMIHCSTRPIALQDSSAAGVDGKSGIFADWILSHLQGASVLRFGPKVLDDLTEIGDPSDGKFFYPVEKRRTESTTNAMRAAEQHLDAFWAKFDQGIPDPDDLPEDDMLSRLLLGERKVTRTAPWLARGPSVSDEQRKIQDAQVSLSELYFELEHRTENKAPQSKDQPYGAKTKVKTRDAATRPITDLQDSATNCEPGESRSPVLYVDTRALRVFGNLFFTPSVSATPGEVD